MGAYNNFNATHHFSSFHLLILILFSIVLFANLIICGHSQSQGNIIGDLACKVLIKNCGQGTCKPNNGSGLLPFDCVCNSGWKKLQVGEFTYPSCIVPDCTLDFNCGGQSPPLPPPPPPPPGNNSANDPCQGTWCGQGTCLRDEAGFICMCNEGAENLFNMKSYACFKECSFGADCLGLGLGILGGSPPPPTPPSGSTQNGSGGDSSNSSRTQQTLTVLMLFAMLLSWF